MQIILAHFQLNLAAQIVYQVYLCNMRFRL